MKRTTSFALVLLLAAVCCGSGAVAQTAAAAGQTPQAGTPGTSTPQAGRTPATTQNGPSAGTPATGAGVQGSGRQRSGSGARNSATRGSQRSAAGRPDSSAPVANSGIVTYGSNPPMTKPTDDRPLLDMTAVGNPLGIRSGTPIQVQLQATADSGHVRNGDTVHATLAVPVGGLPKGTAVQLTVVQASQAGALTSGGELSLQVTRIGRYDVLSVIVTALGKEGAKALPDAAPATGTEAEFVAGKEFSFPAA